MCIRDSAIGVTYGPGLVGALLVGVAEAKAIAYARNIPLVGVHHIEAVSYTHLDVYKRQIIGAVVGSVVMGIVSFPSNLFIVYPAYTKFMPMEAIIGAYSELLPSDVYKRQAYVNVDDSEYVAANQLYGMSQACKHG